MTVKFDADPGAPVNPQPLTNVVDVEAGGGHTCALRTDTSVWCWGHNGNGQLGDNTTNDHPLATPVKLVDNADPAPDTFFDGVKAITAGGRHTCAIMNAASPDDDGQVRCWGANNVGQLGDGSTSERRLPKLIPTIPKAGLGNDANGVAVALTGGDDHTCAVMDNASARCWGSNSDGQLGDGGGNSSAPVTPAGLDNNTAKTIRDNIPPGPGASRDLVTSLSAGRHDTCASLIDSTVSCWGSNSSGQLGDGVGPTRKLPIGVLHLDEGIGGNHSPIAVNDDAGTTAEDTPKTVTVTSNDSDPGDTFTVTSSSDPPHGSTTHTGSAVTYTPDANYCGADVFSYRIYDGHNGAGDAVVTITVTCANDPPTPVDDDASTNAGTSVLIDVLANDTDPDGDTPSLVSVTAPGHGTAVLESGKVRYTPSAGYSGPDAFFYTDSDGHGGTASAAVHVTVAPINHPPIANDDNGATSAGTSVLVNVLANDTDPDAGNTLTITAVTPPSHGNVAIESGQVRYTPTAGYIGPDTFTYTASDGHGGTDNATVQMTVSAVNHPPTAVDDNASTTEDTSVLVNVLANDTDPDAGDTLTIAAPGSPAHGTAVIESGKIRYTPATNYNGPDAFTYTASDGHGGTANATARITVSAVNDPPIANSDSASTSEDASVLVTVLANDSDPDGDAVSLASVTPPGHGTTAIESGKVRYTPASNYCGPDAFPYTISDGHGGQATGSVQVTVSCLNDPPTMTAIANRSIAFGDQLSVAIAAQDPDGDMLTYSLPVAPAGASVSPSGIITWTPAASDIGSRTFTARATDTHGAAAERTFTVTVTAHATALTYTGATSGQYSDLAAATAKLVDSNTGAPLAGKTVTFTLGALTASATTDGAGVATAAVGPLGAPASATMTASFNGSGPYFSSSAASAFTILKESISVAYTGAYLTVTTATSAKATLTASVTEQADGHLGGDFSSVRVNFTTVGPVSTLCTAIVTVSSPGVGTATCTTSALNLAAVPVVAQVNSPSYSGPVDVGVTTVAKAPNNSAVGDGRIDHSGLRDDFGFQALPASGKNPPVGNIVHVFRSGGTAFVVRSSTITSLVRSCTGSKTTKECQATVQASSASAYSVDLATGTVSTVPGTSTIRIDPVDRATSPDAYAVSISGAITYNLGTPTSRSPLNAGEIRVPG